MSQITKTEPTRECHVLILVKLIHDEHDVY